MLDALAAPRAAAGDGLRAALGAEADDRVRALLRDRAVAWARVAGGGAAPLELARAEELAEAVGAWDGPVVLVAPDVPALGAHHLVAVRGDLAAGVVLSTAATGDGSPFIVALSAARDDLLALVGAPFNDLLATAASAGRELGMVRAERRLATVADAQALLADPLTPPELAALLAPLRAA